MARNSGRNLRERAPFLELEMSPFIPDKLEISNALLPDARATRKTVFKCEELEVKELVVLHVRYLKKLRTTARSHLGLRTLDLWLKLVAPFITAETMGSEAMSLSPLAASTEPRATLLVFRVAAERPCV